VPGPVVDLLTLQTQLREIRNQAARIVLTNGWFDLLHVGHLRYLRQARREGDVLVVGVNADPAMGTRDTRGRPIVPAAERAELVAALEPVDFVVVFSEATADALLRALEPHTYVKGGDYSESTLPEATTANEVGARVVFVPLVKDRSSSALRDQLRASGSLADDRFVDPL
jgi:rfaE bifunctional protein nucleotidyltransferase chain/domain